LDPIIIVKPTIVVLGIITNLCGKVFMIKKIKNKTPNEPIIVEKCSMITI
jgi:hypothetical protein